MSKPARTASGEQPPRITLQAARPDLGSEYMQFVFKPDRVEVLYMRSEFRAGKVWLTYRDTECLHFSEYPEARQLHNGLGWNVEELAAWVRLVSEDREFLAAVKA